MARSESYLNISGLSYRVLIWENQPGVEPYVLFLHGFTGSAESFAHIAEKLPCNCLAVDLPGHGKTDPGSSTDRYKPSEVISDLLELLDRINLTQVILVGYSMGARIAMQMAVSHPHRINTLIIESGNPGILNHSERHERFEKDKILSQRLEVDFESFLEIWNRLPLFDSPSSVSSAAEQDFKAVQRSQNPNRLAISLLMNSSGLMHPLHDELCKLMLPVHIITGQSDQKYCTLWSDIGNRFSGMQHHTVSGAGHRVHLDNPLVYTNLLKTIIQS